MPSNKVLFRFGSRAEYDALPSEQVLDNALYFLTDTQELYRGSIPICKAHYYEGSVLPTDADDDATIARIVSSNTPTINDILVINRGNGIKTPYIYAGLSENGTLVYGWRPLHNKVSGEEVVFEDGTSLLDRLNQGGMDYSAIDEKVFTIITDNHNDPVGFTLKDYGIKYYDKDENDEYVAIQVDAQHPWPTGVVPRVISENGVPVLAWFVPDANTAEGQQLDLDNLKRDVADLKTVVGQEASGNDPATGLIKRVGTIEKAYVKEIHVGNSIFRPVNGAITLPIFNGNNNGVVPKPAANLGETYVLGSNGQWVDPSTLFNLEWEEIETT